MLAGTCVLAGMLTACSGAVAGNTSSAAADSSGETSMQEMQKGAEEYVLMNIPYSDFYKAELGDKDRSADVVTCATKKAYSAEITGVSGSYHGEEDSSFQQTDILGITYPVRVEDSSVLNGMKKVEEEADLFAAGDYAYMELKEMPSAYKNMSMADGGAVFGEVSAERKEIADVTAEITALSKRGDYQIMMDGETEALAGSVISGAVLVAEDGSRYPLRALENIWNGAEFAFSTGHTDTIKAGALTPNNEIYRDLEGKTIREITYFLRDKEGSWSVETLAVDLPVGKYPEAVIRDGMSVQISGLNDRELEKVSVTEAENPKSYYTARVYRNSGNERLEVAKDLEVSKDGMIMLPEKAEKGSYTVELVQTRLKEKDGQTKAVEAVMVSMHTEF